MLETALDKLAETILALDEASLSSLWEKYKLRMERFELTKDWEKAVIIFFIINAIRAKNQIFNDQMILRQHQPATPNSPRKRPDLRLVK